MNTPTIPPQHRRRLQAHFAMSKLPFRKNMYAAHMFDSSSQRELLHALQMWSEVRGLSLVTGHSGVGKSITLRRFVSTLDDSRFRLLHFTQIPTTPTGFLRSLCRVLELPMRHHTSDLFDAAQQYLCAHEQESGSHPLLVVDDAEGLKVQTLDLLRRLTAHDLDAEDRFSILLTGTDDLLRSLRHPLLEPLRSRFGYAQPLRPFTLEDTRNYIRFHLERADVAPDLISDEAARRIFQASQGRPRHTNQLALHALIQAAVKGLECIDGDFMSILISAHPLYQSSHDV